MSTVLSIIAGILVGTILVAVATPKVAAAAPPDSPKISFDRAAEIALAHVGNGVVEDIDRERKHGRLVYEVEVVGADGREHELDIDAQHGKIVREEIDD